MSDLDEFDGIPRINEETLNPKDKSVSIVIEDGKGKIGFEAKEKKKKKQETDYEEAERVSQREYYYDLDSLRFIVKHFTRQTTKLDSKGCCYAIAKLMSRIHRDIKEDERQARIIELKAKQLKEGF